MKKRWVCLFFVLLTGFVVSSTAAERLERWVYYSVNLWVDANIAPLQAVLTRASQAGYTHVLLSDSNLRTWAIWTPAILRM